MEELAPIVKSILPGELATKVICVLTLLPYLTRAAHRLANGGGLKGALSAMWLGTNTPPVANPAKDDPRQGKLPIVLCLPLAVMLMTGCTVVKITQRETDLDGYTRETEFVGRSVWDAHNELAKTRTTMTDKTQGISLAGLNQESSSTGVVAMAREITAGATEGAMRALTGGGNPKP